MTCSKRSRNDLWFPPPRSLQRNKFRWMKFEDENEDEEDS